MLEAWHGLRSHRVNSGSTAGKTFERGSVAAYQEQHPLMSFRPLTLLLGVFWVLAIASFAWLRI
jgi:hypothetical protein